MSDLISFTNEETRNLLYNVANYNRRQIMAGMAIQQLGDKQAQGVVVLSDILELQSALSRVSESCMQLVESLESVKENNKVKE